MRAHARTAAVAVAVAILYGNHPVGLTQERPAAKPAGFHLHEATIADIQQAIQTRQITTVDLVKLYLARIKAYNGTCVSQPDGILGVISTIPKAGQLNALATLNLRPASRKALGFDDRKARSLTDLKDDDPALPDALEAAAALDRKFAETGRLVGPLHGVVLAVKDQYDTADMRTTGGADVAYANDRPPDDSTFVTRLKEAGAIILAKANMGSPQPRSAFGGTFCNPYDTERTPGVSSAGSGSSVSANLVTCAIGEETGISIRGPARANSLVGIAPTQELVSRDGMSGAGINMRVGPICRTVEDAARVLTVIAGYDPEGSAHRLQRRPDALHSRTRRSRARSVSTASASVSFASSWTNGCSPIADAESIDIVDRALGDLRSLGATIVDPGPEGALFQGCIRKYAPQALNTLFTQPGAGKFPVDAQGKPAGDHIATLVDMAFDPSIVPDAVTVREFGVAQAEGEGQYMRSRYLRDRGDSKIKTAADVAANANSIRDPRFRGGGRGGGAGAAAGGPAEMNMAERMLQRFAFQQVMLQCMADQNLDAVTYPTSNVPPRKIGAPEEPTVNSRAYYHWTRFGHQGFPTMSVPGRIYDARVRPGRRSRSAGQTDAWLDRRRRCCRSGSISPASRSTSRCCCASHPHTHRQPNIESRQRTSDRWKASRSRPRQGDADHDQQ